jgi:hypothetical protein
MVKVIGGVAGLLMVAAGLAATAFSLWLTWHTLANYWPWVLGFVSIMIVLSFLAALSGRR